MQPPHGYGGPPGPGGYGPPPGKGMSGAAIALIILAVVAVLGFGGCLLCVGGAAFIGSQHDATVNCERANFGSVTCTVIHTRGTGAAEVCWDMKLVCNAG